MQDVGKGNKKKSKPEKVKPILVNKDESPVVTESIASQPPLVNVNHFDVIHPKDDLELIRSQSVSYADGNACLLHNIFS